MNLSKKSWHAKLYDLTYPTALPKNLCPYFWKVVLACILFIPLAIIFAPLKIIWVITKDDESISLNGFISETFFMAILLDAALFLVFSMVFMWFQTWGTKVTLFQGAGIVGWLLLLIGLIVWAVEKIKERREEKRWRNRSKDDHEKYHEPKPNILVEFIRAKYNKYCPSIKWND